MPICRCLHCRQPVDVPEWADGNLVDCPACGRQFLAAIETERVIERDEDPAFRLDRADPSRDLVMAVPPVPVAPADPGPTYQARCPHCGAVVTLLARATGQAFACGACGLEMRAPGAPIETTLAPEPEPLKVVYVKEPRSRRAEFPFVVKFAAFLVVMVLLYFIFIAVLQELTYMANAARR